MILEVQSLCDFSTAEHVFLDLRAIRCFVIGSLYPDSEPIGPMRNLDRKLKEGGRRLALCNLSMDLEDVFRMTRLDQIFEIQHDIELPHH